MSGFKGVQSSYITSQTRVSGLLIQMPEINPRTRCHPEEFSINRYHQFFISKCLRSHPLSKLRPSPHWLRADGISGHLWKRKNWLQNKESEVVFVLCFRIRYLHKGIIGHSESAQ